MLRLFGRRDRGDKERIEQAVGRTRQTWFRRMTRVFQRSQIDDAMWDELEELLFSADIGAGTTMKLLDQLRGRVAEYGLTAPPEALSALKTEMTSLLLVSNSIQAPR